MGPVSTRQWRWKVSESGGIIGKGVSKVQKAKAELGFTSYGVWRSVVSSPVGPG